MPVTHFAVTNADIAYSTADAILLATRATDDGFELLAPAGFTWVADELRVLGASGTAEELIRLVQPGENPRLVVVVGIGPIADAAAFRLAAGSATRQLADTEHLAIGIPVTDGGQAEALLEGAGLGAYRFTKYQSAPKHGVTALTLHTALAESAIRLNRIQVVVEAVELVKDLAATPASDLYPSLFAELAVTKSAELGIATTVFDVDALAEHGFGGILGVGKGSVQPPRMVRLEYAPEAAQFTLALVGKGITFDSGGLSLKPAASMVGMKYDMSGAATVLAATAAIAKLGIPIRIVSWLCLAENMPSGNATRPNDILRIHGGKTVEVLNTDAEGRLVLADGLSAASAEYPDAIVDVATLTGAQQIALGSRISGLMGDDGLVTRLRQAAAEVDEALWPMPLPNYLRSMLKSDVADLANAKMGTGLPGMLIAGIFLKEFIGNRRDSAELIPWAHLDIAGPADNSSAGWGFTGAGPTGVVVRTLIQLSEDISGE